MKACETIWNNKNMWFCLRSVTTSSNTDDWYHEAIISQKKKDAYECIPIPITTVASLQKPLFVLYYMEGDRCENGPLLYTSYQDAYHSLMRKIEWQYTNVEDNKNVVLYQRVSNQLLSSMYNITKKGMSLQSRWILESFMEMEIEI